MQLSLLDRLEIQELIARYNRAIDSGAIEDWVATFTPDGEFRNRAGERWLGHEQLRAFARDYATNEEFRDSEHWVNNIVIEALEEEARVFCHGMIVQRKAGTISIRSMSSYRDLVRHQADGWKFALRRVMAWPWREDELQVNGERKQS